LIGDDLLELLGERVPRDHSRQTLAEAMAASALRAHPAATVLDLGCGTGRSVELFRSLAPGAHWVGVDIDDSAEVRSRTREDAEFHTFDGVNLPFEDRRFGLVYCAQALEHVRHPGPLLAEVARVLAPDGRLAGSTSQLEPFHSRSTWNYTPYGLATLFEDAGLELLELRPSIDALTLIVRRGLRGPRLFDRWWDNESPLNRAIELFGRAARLDPAARNAVKLLFCGQFSFLARRALTLRSTRRTPRA
jgi:SAM-dependent methyltransferase